MTGTQKPDSVKARTPKSAIGRVVQISRENGGQLVAFDSPPGPLDKRTWFSGKLHRAAGARVGSLVLVVRLPGGAWIARLARVHGGRSVQPRQSRRAS